MLRMRGPTRQSELQALLKRIDARRKEHLKQRNLDSKRLLQRNRNVQTVLESKQTVEGLKITEEIKKASGESRPRSFYRVSIPWKGCSTPPCKPPDPHPSVSSTSCNDRGNQSSMQPTSVHQIQYHMTAHVRSFQGLLAFLG